MGKSEYFEIKKVEGEVEQPQIIIDADAIYDLLLRAELMMTKVDRVRYANRAIEQILDVIREFILAYDFEDDRKVHLERMSANIAVFLRTMRIIARRNIICIPTKFDRVYTNDRTIRNCSMAIRKWNRLAYPSRIEHFLSSINSFLGLMKHRNDYGKIRDLVEEVSPKWLKYCHYNDNRRCFEANEGYKHNDILIRKYGFKFNKLKHKKNDKTRNRRQKKCPRISNT